MHGWVNNCDQEFQSDNSILLYLATLGQSQAHCCHCHWDLTIESNFRCFWAFKLNHISYDHHCEHYNEINRTPEKPSQNPSKLNMVGVFDQLSYFLVQFGLIIARVWWSGGETVSVDGGWKSYLNPSRAQRHNVTRLEGIMLPLPRSSSFTSRRSGGSSWRSWWSWW